MSSPLPTPPGAPPSPAARIPVLDVLRGAAILGTLATNVWIFTDPAGLIGYLSGTAAAAAPRGWGALEAVLQQLAQGKSLALLTVLFGIGLEVQRRSAQRAGRPWPGRYRVRAGLLFLDGLVHYLLVAEFDVLMGYAVTGVVVAHLLSTSERAQRRWTRVAAGAHVLLLGLVAAALLLLASPAGAGGGAGGGSGLDPNPYADGSFTDLVVFRIQNGGLFRLEPVFLLALSTALFLVGARLLRAGVLDPAGGALRRRLLLLGAAALPVDLLLGLAGGDAGLVLSRYGTAPLVALGVLALTVEVLQRRRAGGAPRSLGTLGRRTSDVGRTALSCYVLQNLLASALCYGWGLGLAARLDPAARVPGTLGVFVVVAATVVTAAHLWLRRHDRGPLERLSHSAEHLLDRRARNATAPAPR